MIAEEIYPMIDDNIDEEPFDQHLYDDSVDNDTDPLDGGMREDALDGRESNASSKSNKNNKSNNANSNTELAQKPDPLTPDEMSSLASKWQKNLASSAQIAHQAGKLDGEFAKLVDFLQELIEHKIIIHPEIIHGKWCEIDTIQDLEIARKMFKE